MTYDEDLIDTSFVDFYAKYLFKSNKIENKIEVRKTPVIVRTVPNYSSNPEGLNYDKYCKFQLLKYKPWHNDVCSAWGMGMMLM